jgi:hypothetical protein
VLDCQTIIGTSLFIGLILNFIFYFLLAEGKMYLVVNLTTFIKIKIRQPNYLAFSKKVLKAGAEQEKPQLYKRKLLDLSCCSRRLLQKLYFGQHNLTTTCGAVA